MNMKKVTSRMHIIGDLGKPKVMLIHGVGFDWQICFERIIEILKRRYCLLIPELEGHCDMPQCYMSSVKETASRIVESMRSHGFYEIDTIYGISLGASIAIEIGIMNALDIKHLILDSGQYEAMGEMTEQYAGIMADAFLGLLQREHLMSPVKEYMGYTNDRDVAALRPMMHPQITRTALYQAFLAAYSYTIKDRNEKLGMEVYMIMGENELYAKSAIPLVEAVCMNPPKVKVYPDKGHGELLGRAPEVLAKFIRQVTMPHMECVITQ